MKAYLQTRGISADYAFLGAAPPNRWWLDFRDATSFEQPTVIVRSEPGGWCCYLSGIHSLRTDRVGTAIRYTVILEGQCGESTDYVLRLVDAWLSDGTNGGPLQRVQRAMDAVFDEATVERLLAVRGANRESASEVERLIEKAMVNLPASRLLPKSTNRGSWVGSTTSAQAQGEFLARVSELLRGERDGTAALLNLLGTEDEVAKLVDKVGPLGVLIDDPAGALGDTIVSVEKKKPSAAAGAGSRQPTNLWISICILTGLIVLAIWWIIRNP